jgi:hypothetical protein
VKSARNPISSYAGTRSKDRPWWCYGPPAVSLRHQGRSPGSNGNAMQDDAWLNASRGPLTRRSWQPPFAGAGSSILVTPPPRVVRDRCLPSQTGRCRGPPSRRAQNAFLEWRPGIGLGTAPRVIRRRPSRRSAADGNPPADHRDRASRWPGQGRLTSTVELSTGTPTRPGASFGQTSRAGTPTAASCDVAVDPSASSAPSPPGIPVVPKPGRSRRALRNGCTSSPPGRGRTSSVPSPSSCFIDAGAPRGTSTPHRQALK